MRRAIAAAVVGGLLLGGAVATPAVAATGPAMKTVDYAGYEFQVPASWPVYRLDEHPHTCVRYDVHAVYLGRPGPDMRCAAGLVGRTQTVSVIPGRGATAGSAAPGQPGGANGPGGTMLQRLTAMHATITQNPVSRELKVALGTAKPAATVLGTYGTDPAIVEQVLNTLHYAPAGTSPTPQSAPAPVLAPAPAASNKPNPNSTSWHGVPANWPVEIVQPAPAPSPPVPTPTPTPLHPVNGFDTCTAPSTSTMHAWRSSYAAAGVYIGGANAACAYGNLTSGWVKAVTSMGWGLLPAYVGPQAPCWGAGSGVLIKPGSAAAQGSAAGADAVSDARSVGLAAGSPIYYDMEAYNGGTSCTNAVLKFLGAWDRQVQAAGYVTGVYSSQDSGIVDMQSGAVNKMPGFTPPNAVWIALWDNVASLRDGTLTWPLADRSKQYEGNVNATVHGVTLNIDRDFIGGPLARLPGRFHQSTAPPNTGVTTSRQTGSREPPWAHKLTTWPYAATVLTPSST